MNGRPEVLTKEPLLAPELGPSQAAEEEARRLRRLALPACRRFVSTRLLSDPVDERTAAEALIWVSDQLPRAIRERLVARAARDSGPAALLGRWRGGGLLREDLSIHALRHLRQVSAELEGFNQHLPGSDEGKPRKNGRRTLARTRVLHLALRALRTVEPANQREWKDLIDRCARRVSEGLNSEFRARGKVPDIETSRETTPMLIAASSECWRDTAPAASSIRPLIESIARSCSIASGLRSLHRADCAALWIALENLRIEWTRGEHFEHRMMHRLGGPFLDDASAGPSETLGLSRRHVRLDLQTEIVVLRALSGPSRTGPRHFMASSTRTLGEMGWCPR